MSTAPALSPEALIAGYRNMLLSRLLDDKEIALKRQNRIFFQISAAGHEAIQTAAGMALRPGYDYAMGYYRDRALMLQLGMTPQEILLGAFGAEEDPASAGRQMPSHWSSKRLNVISKSSCTGTQFLQCTGAAEASWLREKLPAVGQLIEGHGDEVVLATSGEGTTSQGEFFEALNTASNKRLPVIFLIQDNGYAISTPVEVQTTGGSISALVKNYPNLKVIECDGCDLEASYVAMRDAVAWCRERKGPALVHAHTVRPYSHSMSDDESAYRPASERDADRAADPLARLKAQLLKDGVLDEAALKTIGQEEAAVIELAAEAGLSAPAPKVEDVLDHIYAPVDPCGARFDRPPVPDQGGGQKTMVDLINACLRDELSHDPRVVIFGEDVADLSRTEAMDECKGKGGVFKVTHGLQRKFGAERVFNTPLAEANIVGRAVGMAERGLRPVVEIQFLDYIWPAFQQIRSELATARWRSAGDWPAPVVIRVPSGGYLKGGGPYHSQSAEALFTHIPGLRVVMPSNALDANGLLRTAIRCDDPVLFLEPKHLYRQTHNRALYPGPDHMIPFGKARRVRAGDDLTLITYGATVHRSTVAAKAIERRLGVQVDLLDLRTLAPYDWDAIRESVQRTGRVMVVHEETRAWGYGAEIAARIGEELFEWLDAPVRRVAALDSFVAYHPDLEAAILPHADDIAAAIEALAAY